MHGGAGITEDELLKLCAQAELNSTHPIAVSIVNAAKEKGLELNMPESVQEIAGKGLIVKGGDGELLCGNRLLLEEHQVNVPGIKEEQCGTEVFAAQNGVFIGRILIGDTVKGGCLRYRKLPEASWRQDSDADR